MKIRRLTVLLSILLLVTTAFYAVPPADSARDYFHTGLDVSRSQLKSLVDGWNGALGFAGNESVVALDGTTYYVNANHPTQGDGSTWTKSFKTLTEALAVAIMRNDVIIMAPGDYDEGAVVNITTQGLTIKGADPSGGWHNRAMLLGSGNAAHIMTINAHEVTIQGLGFSDCDDTYDAIRVATTGAAYKVAIKNCRFDAWDGEYGVYADGTYDAPDLAILNNHFRSWKTASIRVNTTRALIGGNIITNDAAGSTSGIQHVPTGTSRPDTTIVDNTIYGTYNSDIGIEIVNTPSERYFHLSGNHVVACETPVTIGKYTNWYVGNFWGKENWRYDPEQGREEALARGANGNLFYVDNNVVAGGTGLDGRCWASAFSTVAAGITAADTDAALHRNWAKRNTIYISGDGIAEVLTVVPEKTDLVGVGTDTTNQIKITGTMTVAATTVGVRFFNLGFVPTTAAPAITVPESSGWEWHNCTFYLSAAATHGILFEAVQTSHKIINCRFVGASSGIGNVFTTAAIEFEAGSNLSMIEIRGNHIEGAKGILVDAMTQAGQGLLIEGNTIYATTQPVDDDDSTFFIVDNNLITAGASGAAGVTAMDCNLLYATGNNLVTSDGNGPYPVLDAHN